MSGFLRVRASICGRGTGKIVLALTRFVCDRVCLGDMARQLFRFPVLRFHEIKVDW